jgi:hypothetical protein
VSWLFNRGEIPRSPQDWIGLAARMPVTPRQWLEFADELSRSPTRMLITVLEAVGASFVDRELELRADSGRVTMVLRSLTGSHDDPPVAMGALRPTLDLEGIERVEVEADDVRWARGAIDHLHVTAHRVRIEPGLVASLVAGPILLRGEVGQATLDEWNDRADGPLRRVQLLGEGTVRAWVRRGLSADLSVDVAEGDGGVTEMRFRVQRARVLGVPVPMARMLVRERVVVVPPLPRRMKVVAVHAHPDRLRVEAHVERFREPVNPEHVIKAASTVGSHVVVNLR